MTRDFLIDYLIERAQRLELNVSKAKHRAGLKRRSTEQLQEWYDAIIELENLTRNPT